MANAGVSSSFLMMTWVMRFKNTVTITLVDNNEELCKIAMSVACLGMCLSNGAKWRVND